MTKKILLTLLLMLSSLTIALAQNTDTSGVGDSIFPNEGNGGYDVQHYDLNITWDGAAAITASAELYLIPTETLTQFNLDFHGLTVDSITVNGLAAEFERDGDELIITPASELVANESVRVGVQYHGKPNALEDNLDEVGGVIGGWHTTDYGVYVASEPNGAKSWYPVNNHPTDPATYTFRVTVPKPNTVIANGLLTDEIDNGDTTTFVWEARDPIASYLTTVVIGDYRLEEQVGPNSLPIYNYYHVDVSGDVLDGFAEQPAMLERFEEVFGAYPFESAGAIVIPEPYFPALETQTRAIYGEQATAYPVIAHELAHQWFGNAITLEDWRDIWIKEGFATYAEYLYEEVREDGDPERMLSDFVQYVQWDSTAPSDVSSDNLYHTGVYVRAGLMLHHLRLRLGDDLFFNLTREYVQQFQGDSASSEDFMSLAETMSGEDLDDFFDAWINQDALPEMAVEASDDFGSGFEADESEGDFIVITPEMIDAALPAEDANGDSNISIDEIDSTVIGVDLTTLNLENYDIDLENINIEDLYFVLIENDLVPFEHLIGEDTSPENGQESEDITDNETADDSAEPLTIDAPPIDAADVEWGDLDVREQRLFTQMSTMFRVFREQGDEMWNNGRFRFDEMPMMFVYRDAENNHPYAYLINHPNPEALDATPVTLDAGLELPTVYRVENHDVLNKIDSQMYFDFARDVAGTATFVMIYRDGDIDAFQSADYWDYSLFTVHEAFHQYQLFDARWQESSDATQDISQYPLTQENVSLVLLEDRILATALASDDVDFQREALQQFLAVRLMRIEQNDLIRRLENNQEAIEGTARYIEYRFQELTGIQSELSPDAITYVTTLEQSMVAGDLSNEADLRDELGFGRAYSSGGALGLLLDDVGIDWHSRVEAGETLVDILENTFGLSEDDLAELLAETKIQYDYDDIEALVAEQLG